MTLIVVDVVPIPMELGIKLLVAAIIIRMAFVGGSPLLPEGVFFGRPGLSLRYVTTSKAAKRRTKAPGKFSVMSSGA